MSSLRLTALATLAALAVWAWPTVVAEAQERQLTVEGRVANGTSAESSVEGLSVALHRVSATGRDDVETLTDNAGGFRFDGIVLDPEVAYGVSVIYQGALYGVDLDTSSGSPPLVTLTVYDATHDDGAVSASLASVLFASADKESQTVSALEIVKIVNDSNQTYVPGPEPMNLLRFGLPPEARGLQVDTSLPGADYAQVDRGFALLASVPPGEHEVMYAYDFPYSGDSAAFSKSLLYGAESLRILAPEGELGLSGSELGETGAVKLGGRPYQLIEAVGLPRGSRIAVTLQGLPELSAYGGFRQRLKSIRFEYSVPVALGMLMLCAFGFVFWRKRRAMRPARAEESDELGAHLEIVTIRQMIADLERALEAGSLSAGDYRRRRKLLETRLASLETTS